MDTQTTPPAAATAAPRNPWRVLYWIAAAAMLVAVALEFMNPPVDYLKIGSRAALLGALLLLATARPAETKTKKTVIYLLVGVAAVLLVVRLAR